MAPDAPPLSGSLGSRALQAAQLLAIVSLLAATATALAPPFLAKYALDDGDPQRAT